MKWAVSWYPGEAVTTVFLLVATVVVVSVPVAYLLYANLRDPLARAVLAGTSVTGLAFVATLITTVAFHMGWDPSRDELNWIARGLYSAVAVGKAAFLLGLLRVVRDARALDREHQQASEQATHRASDLDDDWDNDMPGVKR